MAEDINSLMKKLADQIVEDTSKAKFGLDYVLSYFVHESVCEASRKLGTKDDGLKTMEISVEAGEIFLDKLKELGERC